MRCCKDDGAPSHGTTRFNSGDMLLAKPTCQMWVCSGVKEPTIANGVSQPSFQDETAAYAKLESIVWLSGAVCPHCGSTDRMRLMGGKATRPSLHKCYAYCKQSRVTLGTVFGASHIKLHVWLQAAYLMCASREGISSNQLARVLGLTVKSAWFMSHRLRVAMTAGALLPMGGEGATVGIDETFIGSKYAKQGGARGYAHNNAILTLAQRGGSSRSQQCSRMAS